MYDNCILLKALRGKLCQLCHLNIIAYCTQSEQQAEDSFRVMYILTQTHYIHGRVNSRTVNTDIFGLVKDKNKLA